MIKNRMLVCMLMLVICTSGCRLLIMRAVYKELQPSEPNPPYTPTNNVSTK